MRPLLLAVSLAVTPLYAQDPSFRGSIGFSGGSYEFDSDLAGFDEAVNQSLGKIARIDEEGIDEDLFEDLFFETFTAILSNGAEVEVCEGCNFVVARPLPPWMQMPAQEHSWHPPGSELGQ